jgi:hypothetical protein
VLLWSLPPFINDHRFVKWLYLFASPCFRLLLVLKFSSFLACFYALVKIQTMESINRGSQLENVALKMKIIRMRWSKPANSRTSCNVVRVYKLTVAQLFQKYRTSCGIRRSVTGLARIRQTLFFKYILIFSPNLPLPFRCLRLKLCFLANPPIPLSLLWSTL